MNNKINSSQYPVEDKLGLLQDIPTRDEKVAQNRRANFLEHARQMEETFHLQGAVSSNRYLRQTWWNQIFTRKGTSKMSFISSMLIALALIFGGTGITVAAAQSAMPDEFLYPVKLASEEIAVDLSANPEAEINTDLALLQRRAEEMNRLTFIQGQFNEDAALRLMARLDETLRDGAALDNEQMLQTMDRIQTQLHTMLQVMEQNNLSDEPRQQMLELMSQIQLRIATLQQTQNMEELRIRIHNGQFNGETLGEQKQEMNQNQQRNNNPASVANTTSTPETEATSTGTGKQNQGNGSQYGVEGTPTPEGTPTENGYGPGPQGTPQKNKP